MIEQTEEQRRKAYEDAGVIDTAALAPATPIEVNTYKDTTTDVGNLKVDLTPVQQQAQSSTEELQNLIKQLGGESAYTEDLSKQKDIEGLSKITTEQGTIVQNLQIEAQRLANQYAGVEDVMQAESEGRGRTVGGLAPLTAGEQRKIAIQQRAVASQALTAYAAYNTAKGNLEIAQMAIDKAVAAKYNPIKEQIDIKMKNLELLLGSPLATAQEKALAQAQLKKQEAEKKKVDEQEGYFSTIQNLYVQLAANPNADATSKNTIRKLLDKKEITIDDVATATSIASPFLQEEVKYAAGIIGEYQYYAQQEKASGRVPVSFNEYQNMDANRKIAIAKAQVAGVDTSVANIAIKFGEKFDASPIVKQFNEVQNKKLGIDQLLASGASGPADVALVYDFMKALDPTSVVRESEYAMGAQSGNIFAGWAAKFNGYFRTEGGKLPESVKTEFQKIINQRYNAISQQYDNLYNETSRKIKATTGIQDTSMFLTDYKQAAGTSNIYEPGTIIHNEGIMYLVGEDGETITPIGSSAL